MTREEAIKSLEAQRDCIILSCSGACHEGKECDECDFMYGKGTMGEMRDAYDVAIKALREQKDGKWVLHREDIVYTNGYLTKERVVCSKCGGEAFFDSETGLEETPYCPHCGARMEGADNE